jgi:CHAT domain-containing protein/tetratricopeptide (TPR) repeat protein
MRAGEFEQGEALSYRASQLGLRYGGQEDPDVAYGFLHLANIREYLGDLTGAEQSYNAACGVLNAAEGEATPLKAEVLLAYGSLYNQMGLALRASLLLDHAQSRYLDLYGPNSEHVGRCLAMKATAYESLHFEEEAAAAYQEAIRILSAAWGPTHPSVAYIEWSRAGHAFWRASRDGDSKAVEQALAEMRAGLAQLEADSDSDDADVAARRAHIGSCLVTSGHFEEGAELLSNAIAVLKKTGEDDAPFCRQLATARARLGDPAGALALVRNSIRQASLGQQVAHGSSRERMKALELAHEHVAQYLDLFLLAGKGDAGDVLNICNLVLSQKGLGAEMLLEQRQTVSHGGDPELPPLMARLADLRARSAQQSLASSGRDETLVEIERVEWELASRTPAIELSADQLDFDHKTAAALLPKQAVLIEFLRFTRRTGIWVDPDAEEDGARDWYVAFVIFSAPGEQLKLIDLGPASEIDGLVAAYRRSLERAGGTARHILRSGDAGAEDVGDTIKRRLVDPLVAAVEQRTRVLIAPDGELTNLPFEALPDGPGRYLIDTLDINYLSTGRDLRRLSIRTDDFTPGSPIVLADPDYDLPGQAPRQSGGDPSGEPGRGAAPLMSGDRAQLHGELKRSGIHFGRLPGTRAEGVAIASLLSVEPLLGHAATEEALKAADSPLLIHVATHGFFLPEPESRHPSDDDGAGARLANAARNPLTRSGLALAGANAWLGGATVSENVDDGIVTGEDIVGMDLLATELVVLSACETGLGDVIAGEGVMGLRRAFAVAGARTLVLSLWKVPDEQTRMLMTRFYQGLISGQGRAESLRAAQDRVRREFPEPFYWAAFICQGDPGPMPSEFVNGTLQCR